MFQSELSAFPFQLLLHRLQFLANHSSSLFQLDSTHPSRKKGLIGHVQWPKACLAHPKRSLEHSCGHRKKLNCQKDYHRALFHWPLFLKFFQPKSSCPGLIFLLWHLQWQHIKNHLGQKQSFRHCDKSLRVYCQ